MNPQAVVQPAAPQPQQQQQPPQQQQDQQQQQDGQPVTDPEAPHQQQPLVNKQQQMQALKATADAWMQRLTAASGDTAARTVANNLPGLLAVCREWQQKLTAWSYAAHTPEEAQLFAQHQADVTRMLQVTFKLATPVASAAERGAESAMSAHITGCYNSILAAAWPMMGSLHALAASAVGVSGAVCSDDIARLFQHQLRQQQLVMQGMRSGQVFYESHRTGSQQGALRDLQLFRDRHARWLQGLDLQAQEALTLKTHYQLILSNHVTCLAPDRTYIAQLQQLLHQQWTYDELMPPLQWLASRMQAWLQPPAVVSVSHILDQLQHLQTEQEQHWQKYIAARQQQQQQQPDVHQQQQVDQA